MGIFHFNIQLFHFLCCIPGILSIPSANPKNFLRPSHLHLLVSFLTLTLLFPSLNFLRLIFWVFKLFKNLDILVILFFILVLLSVFSEEWSWEEMGYLLVTFGRGFQSLRVLKSVLTVFELLVESEQFFYCFFAFFEPLVIWLNNLLKVIQSCLWILQSSPLWIFPRKRQISHLPKLVILSLHTRLLH